MKRSDGTYTGNKQVGLRISKGIENKMEEGMKLTGLDRAEFIRVAIIEKAEREIIKAEMNKD